MYRIFGHFIPKTILVLLVAEASILLVSVYLAATIDIADHYDRLTGSDLKGVMFEAALFCAAMMCGMIATGLYQRDQRDSPLELILRIVVSFGIGLALMSVVWIFDVNGQFRANTLALALFASFVGIASCRLLYFDKTHDRLARRVLVLGAGRRASRIAELRRASDRHGIDVIGFLDMGSPQRKVADNRIIDANDPLSDLVDREDIDEIVIALDDRRNAIPVEEMLDCKMQGVRIIDVDDFCERQLGKVCVDSLQPSQLFFSEGLTKAIVRPWGKRSLDIAVSLMILTLLSPVMLMTALAVKLESPGPVFYRQRRVGRAGHVFTLCKFRSMRSDAESDGVARWATSNDARVTRVGQFIRKTRIDELPQLINVLKGDMSFVGPRPERPEFVADLCEQIDYYELRHYVKPGITGWAQVRYPYGASVDDSREKLKYDLYYIKNYSLFLDLNIILHTIQVVLWRKGAR